MSDALQCRGCRRRALEKLLDFGPQPPSNRFEQPGASRPDRHPLVVGQCAACGLVQLIEPMPPAMAKSRFEWLTYNEPEGHLDDIVSRLAGLPGVGPDARIAGLTYKDGSTLARFNRLGYANTYRVEPRDDLGLDDPCTGLESIQSAVDVAAASRIAARHGATDLLLVRHVLEHAHDPRAFLEALRMLVKPDGYVLFEMPDCSKFIRACDYSFLWEEHITYFSAPTLRAFVDAAGLVLEEIIVHPYPLEDSLIAVVRNAAARGAAASEKPRLDALLAHGRTFADRYPERRAALQALFGAWKRSKKRVAVFGAGHLAAKFVNLYGLQDMVECVVDDNPNKQALLMPGSRLPIRGSAVLDEIDLCLLSLNPESEQKVLAKYQAYLERGGRFLSIFALSPKSVYNASAA